MKKKQSHFLALVACLILSGVSKAEPFFQEDKFCIVSDVKSIVGNHNFDMADSIVFGIDQVHGDLQVAGKATNITSGEVTIFWYIVNVNTCSLQTYFLETEERFGQIMSLAQGHGQFFALSKLSDSQAQIIYAQNQIEAQIQVELFKFDLNPGEELIKNGFRTLNAEQKGFITSQRLVGCDENLDCVFLDKQNILDLSHISNAITVASYDLTNEKIQIEEFTNNPFVGESVGLVSLDHGFGSTIPAVRLAREGPRVATCSHLPQSEGGSVFFDSFDLSSGVLDHSSYEDSNWSACLGVYIEPDDTSIAHFLLLTPSYEVRKVTVDFDNQYYSQLLSDVPLEISSYDFESLYNFGALGETHQALFAMTDQLSGQQFTDENDDPYEVGVIFQLDDTMRQRKIFEHDESISLSQANPTVSLSGPDTSHIIVTSTLSYDATEAVNYLINLIITETTMEDLTFNKNQWRKRFCPEAQQESITTVCAFYSYQDSYSCEQSSRTQIYDPDSVSEIGTLCSGSVYLGYVTGIDYERRQVVDSPLQLSMDRTHLEWQDSFAVSQRGKVVIYAVQYFTDDLELRDITYIQGVAMNVVFRSLEEDEEFSYTFFENSSRPELRFASSMPIATQICMYYEEDEEEDTSCRLLDDVFIYDQDSLTFSVDSARARGLRLNGRYEHTFYFAREDSGSGEVPKFDIYTTRFVILYAHEAPNQSEESEEINIDEPFGLYYLNNAKTSKYKMTPPSETQKAEAAKYSLEQSMRAQQDGKSESSQETAQISVPKDWSDDDYKQALEWYESKAAFSEEVLIQDYEVVDGTDVVINFSQPGVNFPSYILKQFSQNLTYTEPTDETRRRRLSTAELQELILSDIVGKVFVGSMEQLTENKNLISEEALEQTVEFATKTGQEQEALEDEVVDCSRLRRLSLQRVLQEDEYMLLQACLPQGLFDDDDTEEEMEKEEIKLYFGELDSMITLWVYDQGLDDLVKVDQSLFSLQIASLSNTQMRLAIRFDEVKAQQSTQLAENSDLYMKFGFFEFDEAIAEDFELDLPTSLFFVRKEKKEEKRLGAATAASVAVVSSAIVSTIVAGSLSQIWGLINGMELMIYMRLLSVFFPENASWVISNLIPIANFELPYMTVRGCLFWLSELPDDELDSSSAFEPEGGDLEAVEEEFMSALGDLEFDLRFMGDALGTPYLFWLLSYPIYFVIFLPGCICRKNHKKNSRLARFGDWLRKSYIWDFSIRFLLQTSLDIYLNCLLNFRLEKTPFDRLSESESFMETIDLVHQVFFFFIALAMPLGVLLFLCCNQKKLGDADFRGKYESSYSDLDIKKRSSFLQPFFFLMHRLTLVVISLTLIGQGPLQLLILLEITMFKCVYLSTFFPMKEKFTQGTEYFNEFCLAMVTITMLGMTEEIDEEFDTSTVSGWVYVIIIACNISVHFFFLIQSTGKNIIKACRKREYKRKIKDMKERGLIDEQIQIIQRSKVLKEMRENRKQSQIANNPSMQGLMNQNAGDQSRDGDWPAPPIPPSRAMEISVDRDLKSISERSSEEQDRLSNHISKPIGHADTMQNHLYTQSGLRMQKNVNASKDQNIPQLQFNIDTFTPVHQQTQFQKKLPQLPVTHKFELTDINSTDIVLDYNNDKRPPSHQQMIEDIELL